MAQTLEVKVVSKKEWEQLRSAGKACAHVDEESMGFADPSEGKAYVRQTHWADLNKYLLQHEFEHLLEEEGTDECVHGMRHKRGFLRNYLAVMAAPFSGGASLFSGGQTQHPVIGQAGGGLNQYGNAILGTGARVGGGIIGGIAGGPPGAAVGAGLGSALGDFATNRPISGRNAALSAGVAGLGSLASGAGSNVVSRLNPQGGIGSAPYGPSQFGTGLRTQPVFPSGIPGATNIGPGGPAQAQPGLSRFQPGGGGTPPPVPSQTPTQTPPPQGGNWLSNLIGQPANQTTNTPATGLTRFGLGANVLGPAALGTAIAGFGQTAGPKRPEVPDLGNLPAINQFRSDVTSTLGPLAQRFGNLSSTPLPDTLASPIREQYRRQRANITSQFKAFRPGADLATDSGYRQAMADVDRQEAEAMSSTQLNFQENERQNLLGQLGVDQTQLQLMGELANLDITTIMAQTGLSAQDASQFKEMFGQIGGAIAGSGFMNQAMGRIP